MPVNVFDVRPKYGYLGREDLLQSIQPELQRRQQKIEETPSLLKPIKGLPGVDSQLAQEIYQKDSDELNQIVSKENYSDIYKGTVAFRQKKLTNSMYGNEGALETKYKKYYDWVDELNKSKADPELKEKLPLMILEDYNQRGGTTKGANLNLPSFEEDQRENIQKRADDLGKELRESAKLNDYQTIGDWAKSKLTNLGVKYEDFIGDDMVYESYKIKGNEGLANKIINKIIKQDLRTNPLFSRYYEQKAKVDIWDKYRTVRGSGYNPEDTYLMDEENTALDVAVGNKMYNEGLNSEEDYKKLKRTAVDNYLKEKKINEIIDPYANTASKTYSFNPTQEISRDVQKLDFQLSEEYKTNTKRKAEDINIPLTSYIEKAGFGSQFKIPEDLRKKNNELSTSNKAVITHAANLINETGNKLLFPSQIELLNLYEQGNSKVTLSSFAANDEQRDAITKYMAEIEQNNKLKKSIESYENKAKTASGLTTAWKPTEKATIAGQEAYNDVIHTKITELKEQPTIELLQGIKDNAEKARISKMKETDSNYKKYQEWLENNAKTSTELIGVTNLPTKSLANILSGILERDLTAQGGLGAKDLKTGEPLTEIENYSNIGKIDPNEIGYFFEEGKVKLVVRPNILDSKGKNTEQKKDYISVDAPTGTLGYILQEGHTTEKQVIANNIIDSAKNIPDGIVEINFQQDKETIPVKIRSLSLEEIKNAPQGKTHTITVNGVTNYYTHNSAIDALVDLSNQIK